MRYPMRLHPDKYFIWIKHNFDDAQKNQFDPIWTMNDEIHSIPWNWRFSYFPDTTSVSRQLLTYVQRIVIN